MKHPSLKNLQDYFENELDTKHATAIKEHTDECQRCSLILSEIAKVDVLFSKAIKGNVSPEVKSQTLKRASTLLKQRRAKTSQRKESSRLRKEKLDQAQEAFINWHLEALRELKIPALQAASLSLFLVVLTKLSTTQNLVIEDKLIDDSVQVIYSEGEGEYNEVN